MAFLKLSLCAFSFLQDCFQVQVYSTNPLEEVVLHVCYFSASYTLGCSGTSVASRLGKLLELLLSYSKSPKLL